MATIEATCASLAAQPGPLAAVQHIRRMRGGTQPHLLRASDGNFYVVKFQNNPQHIRVLANEFLATRLGRWLGLPMPEVEIIEVPDWLIRHTPELRLEIQGTWIPCGSGLQLASRYVAVPGQDRIFDYLPKMMFPRISNRHDFSRILSFDKWAGNCDGRQAVFTQGNGQGKYRMTFIDQHYCFDGGNWAFPDLPFMGTHDREYVYGNVTGWDSFEPVLSRIEAMDYSELCKFAAEIPAEWYEQDAPALCRLIEMLYKRRRRIRDLITNFRISARDPFPHWARKKYRQSRMAGERISG